MYLCMYVLLERPDQIVLNVCLPIPKIIIYSHLMLRHGGKVDTGNFYEMLTIDEILESVPSSQQMLKKCKVRNPDKSTAIQTFDSLMCAPQFMKLSRYIMGGYVCYEHEYYGQTSRGVWDHSVAFGVEEQSVLRSIILDDQLLDMVEDFRVFYSRRGKPPHKEFTKAARGQRAWFGNKRFGIRYYFVSHSSLSFLMIFIKLIQN